MCGRYKLTTPVSELEEHFQALISNADPIHPVMNVTPGMVMPVVAVGRERIPVITTFRWGLVPSWSKDPKTGYKMINARSETITEKPSFREPIARRRCIIPANGFYEWKSEGKQKLPHYICRTDQSLMSFAGVYDRWKYPDGKDLFTFSIITTRANPMIEHIHERMPVVLQINDYRTWLDPSVPVSDVLPLLRPFDADLTSVSALDTMPE